MKRLLPIFLIICLLLCACTPAQGETEPSTQQTQTTAPSTSATQPQESTAPTTQPTEPETEPTDQYVHPLTGELLQEPMTARPFLVAINNARAALPLLGAALRSDTVDAREANLKHAVVLIGSEGRGLSEEALSACDRTIRIPMSERCESLNAAIAASTLLWEGYR